MSVASQFAKTAGGELAQLQSMAPNMIRQQANSDILKSMLAGLGVGAAARGGLGLARMLHGNMAAKPPKTLGPVVTKIPVPMEEEEEQMASFLGGDGATSKTGIPYYMPSMMLGTGAALAGGWAGIDKLLDSRRKKQQQEKLDNARAEFEQALLTQPGQKMASDSSGSALGEELDRLFDGVEKSADSMTNVLGQGAGLYGAYAGGSGLLGAYLAYSLAKKQQRRAVFEKAQQRRLVERSRQRPNEIYAVQTPVPSSTPNSAEHRDDLKDNEPEIESTPEIDSDPDVLKMPGVE